MKLRELCTLFTDGDWIESKDQSASGIRLVQTGNIGEGKFLDKAGKEKFISEETFKALKCTEVFPGDVLISRLPDPVGRGCIVPRTEQKMITAVDCTICRVNEDVITRKYFCYYLQSGNYYQQLEQSVTGTTRKRISRKNLGNVEVPVPPIRVQKEITDRLDCLAGVMSAKRQQLDFFGNLIKARFVEMFGDSEMNPRGWEMVPIGVLVSTIESGWSGKGTQRKRKTGEIAVLKVSAVTSGVFLPDECKVLDDQENIKKSVHPEKGDLIFSRANTREMVGATAIVHDDYRELILPDKLWKIRFSEKVDIYYMKYILSSKSVREKFSAVSTGTSGSMYNVSMDKFKNIAVPLPPKLLQEKFADFVTQIDKSKVVVQIFASVGVLALNAVLGYCFCNFFIFSTLKRQIAGERRAEKSKVAVSPDLGTVLVK